MGTVAALGGWTIPIACFNDNMKSLIYFFRVHFTNSALILQPGKSKVSLPCVGCSFSTYFSENLVESPHDTLRV